MNILSKIGKLLSGLITPKHIKKLLYTVESVDHDKLEEYENSLGWYLEKLAMDGKIPANIMHISTIGPTEWEILAYYDETICNEAEVINFLRDSGVEVSKNKSLEANK